MGLHIADWAVSNEFRVGTVGLTGQLCRTTTLHRRKRHRLAGPGALQVDWLVAVRPKIVHRRVWIAAYSNGMPAQRRAGVTSSQNPSTSASHYDNLRVQRS